MLIGLGTDIVEIARIKQKLLSNPDLKYYLFSENEIAYCESKKNPYESYAIRFAAKEALLKALGRGLQLTRRLCQIEILRNAQGCPYISVHTELQAKIHGFASMHLWVSMSHSEHLASATVILETR